MRLRYKTTGAEFESHKFNTSAIAEVLTGDDSAFVSDLDVFVNGQWKDLRQAFKDHDVITDNHNSIFFEPKTDEDKKRGYTLY